MKFPYLEYHTLNRLAEKMRRGDRDAATQFYHLLVKRVYGFCMNRVKEQSLAEDITQEIFLKLVDKIEMFESGKGAFVVWFWKLARNTLIDHLRKRTTREFAFTDMRIEESGGEYITFEETIASEENQPAALEHKMKLEKVMHVLQSFSEEEKTLFELRFIADLHYRDIATLTGKPEGALRVAINRIRKKIEKGVL